MATLEELQRQKEYFEREVQLLDVADKSKAAMEARKALRIAELELIKEQTDSVEQQQRIQQQINDLQKEQATGVRDLASALSEVVSGLNANSTAMGAVDELLKNITQSGRNVADVFRDIVKITAAAAIETDKLRASYVALTGDVSDAGKAFTNLAITNTELAISMEQMMKTTTELRAGFSQFAFISQDLRDTLTVQAATMEKVGVNAGTTAESLNTLTMAFGMTTSEAMDTQREMVGLAVALGRPPQEMIQEFNRALPQLAKFGDEAVDVFRNLQITARETGTSIEELTAAFGSQLDTFRGSAEVAGRLNAVLGTDLVSGTELLMASEAERVEILRERLALSGQDFENMTRFQRIAVANAAGISDLATAAKLFGTEQGQVAEMIGDTGISVEQMEEMAMKATDSFTQLRFVFLQLAVAVKPLADFFGFAVDMFVKFIDMIPGGIGTLLAIGGIAAAIPTGGASLAVSALGVGAAVTQGINDGIISNGRVTPINSADDVVAAKPGGPIMEAMSGRAGGGSPTNLVVQVMLDNRQLGEAIVPYIDKRVLGTG